MDDATRGLNLVRRNYYWQLLGPDGCLIRNLMYDQVNEFIEGRARVIRFLASGPRNQKGELLYHDYVEEKVPPKQDLFGFIDETGKEIIPLQYHNAWEFKDGLAVVQYGYRYGFINSIGAVILPFQYDFVYSFENQRAIVGRNYQYDLIDMTGRRLKRIPCKILYPFDENGLARAENEEGLFYIDRNGDPVNPE